MEFEMRKFALLLLCLAVFFTGELGATEKSVTVTVSGKGMSRNEALADAFQEAVRKVVGMYVVSQSKLNEKKFEELIYINADAVISQYKEIKTEEKNGIWYITLDATVVKNEFYKYITKKRKSEVADTEIINLLNKRKARIIVLNTLDYLLKNCLQNICTITKVGEIEFTNASEYNEYIEFNLHYKVRFNRNAYFEFFKKMRDILDRCCIAKHYAQVTGSGWQVRREAEEKFFRKCKRPDHTRIIVFEHHLGNNKYGCLMYLLPIEIYSQIYKSLNFPKRRNIEFDNHAVIVTTGGNLTSSRCVRFGFFQSTGYYCENITFYDRLYFNGDWVHSAKNFTWKLRATENELKSIKRFDFKIFNSYPAAYLWALIKRNSSDMDFLAECKYLPAMIAMAESFNKPQWYHNAALMGSRKAQQQLDWKNGGLGFEVAPTRNGLTVWSAKPGSGIEKGMVLKSINGSAIPRYTRDVSKLIGAFTAGESVSIEFTNGKSLNFTVQDL